MSFMRRIRVLVVSTGFLCTALTAVPVEAHHSLSEFDTSKSVSYTGTVSKFEWQNPHVWIWLQVQPPEGSGPPQTAGFECASISALKRQGLNWNSVKAGDKVTIIAAPMRGGKPGGAVLQINWADGRTWTSELQRVTNRRSAGSAESR